jgi:hypothetical protein
MRFKRKHREVAVPAREDRCETLAIRFWKARDRHILEVQAVPGSERGFRPGYLLKDSEPIVRDDLDVVHVRSRASEPAVR